MLCLSGQTISAAIPNAESKMFLVVQQLPTVVAALFQLPIYVYV
jgi:hypothetical protein